MKHREPDPQAIIDQVLTAVNWAEMYPDSYKFMDIRRKLMEIMPEVKRLVDYKVGQALEQSVLDAERLVTSSDPGRTA
jgi:hypothetical protein